MGLRQIGVQLLAEKAPAIASAKQDRDMLPWRPA